MMKALYKGEPADIWEIGKTTPSQIGFVKRLKRITCIGWIIICGF